MAGDRWRGFQVGESEAGLATAWVWSRGKRGGRWRGRAVRPVQISDADAVGAPRAGGGGSGEVTGRRKKLDTPPRRRLVALRAKGDGTGWSRTWRGGSPRGGSGASGAGGGPGAAVGGWEQNIGRRFRSQFGALAWMYSGVRAGAVRREVRCPWALDQSGCGGSPTDGRGRVGRGGRARCGGLRWLGWAARRARWAPGAS